MKKLALLGFFVTWGIVSAEAKTPIPNPTTVWEHHIEAWSHRDLDGIVSDYDETSLLIINGKTYIGLDQIRTVFSSLFKIFDTGENRIDPTVINGRIVYITWHFTMPGFEEFYGADTFVIEQGKIKVQTIASPLYEAFPITEKTK
jgi:hypothetical protein